MTPIELAAYSALFIPVIWFAYRSGRYVERLETNERGRKPSNRMRKSRISETPDEDPRDADSPDDLPDPEGSSNI